jgi:type IV secretory pathway VirB10-like protein
MLTHVRQFAVASVLVALTPIVHATSCSDCTEECNNNEPATACIEEADEAAGYAGCGVLIVACMARCQSNCADQQNTADTSATQAMVQQLQTDASAASAAAGQAVQNMQQQGSQPSADAIAAMAAFQQLQQAANNAAALTPAEASASSDESDQEAEKATQQAFQQALEQTNALMYQQSRQAPLTAPIQGPQLRKAPSSASPASYGPACHPDPGSDYCVTK